MYNYCIEQPTMKYNGWTTAIGHLLWEQIQIISCSIHFWAIIFLSSFTESNHHPHYTNNDGSASLDGFYLWNFKIMPDIRCSEIITLMVNINVYDCLFQCFNRCRRLLDAYHLNPWHLNTDTFQHTIDTIASPALNARKECFTKLSDLLQML